MSNKNPQEIVEIKLSRIQVVQTLQAIGVAMKSPNVDVDGTVALSNLFQVIRIQEENYQPPNPPNGNPVDSNTPSPG